MTDDASDDETIGIITDFARTAPFDVKLFQNPQRLGFGHNFGKALAHCRGDIVFLCDQDDYWFPEKIERIVELAQAMPKIQLFVNDAIITDADLQPTAFSLLGQLDALSRSRSALLAGCCSAVKRDLLQLCLPIPNGVNAHDIWISKIAEKCSTKSVCDQALQYYRRHDKNATQNATSLQRKITRKDRFKSRMAFYLTAVRNVGSDRPEWAPQQPIAMFAPSGLNHGAFRPTGESRFADEITANHTTRSSENRHSTSCKLFPDITIPPGVAEGGKA